MFALAADGQAQGIFFWIAVYAFVMLLFSLVYQVKISSWPSVTGELIDEKIREFGYAYAHSNKEYRVVVTYKYVVGNREYVGTRLSPWVFVTNNNARFILRGQFKSILRHPNGKVAVYYSPNKPNKSFLIKPGWVGKFVTAALSVIPLFLYIAKYHG